MYHRKKPLVLLLIIALLLGSLGEPIPGMAAEAQPDSSATAGVDVLPSASPGETPSASSTGTPTATPNGTPTATPTEMPTETPKPILTPRPGAAPLLGTEGQKDIVLNMGDQGYFDIDRSNSQAFSSSVLSQLTKIEYQSADSAILQMDQEGNYRAVGVGHTTIIITGYNENAGRNGDTEYGGGGERLFQYTYVILVYPDMSGVTLEKNSVVLYHMDGSYGTEYVQIKINSPYVLDGQAGSKVTLTSSNEDMFVFYELSGNVLTLECGDEGSTQLTVTINGKEFVIDLRVIYISLSRTSLLLVQKKGKKLKIRGTSYKAKWSSSNKKVVSVTSQGRLKAKKTGNAIIKAKVGNCTLGCVVSVVTARKKKVIARALNIARTSVYSQARRMQRGYYDCSSLVWRAYAPSGYKFGASRYAPTAATEAQWLEGRKKMIKGGYSRKNVENLKLQAGDLLFRTGAQNGRYRGIYHVEMIVGYAFYGFDSKGRAIVASKWATKGDGHYAYGSGIVGRP